MFRGLQFTFPEGAIFAFCADQKLSTLQTKMDDFRTNSRNITGRNPPTVIPLLANQDLVPMLTLPPLRMIMWVLHWYCFKTCKHRSIQQIASFAGFHNTKSSSDETIFFHHSLVWLFLEINDCFAFKDIM